MKLIILSLLLICSNITYSQVPRLYVIKEKSTSIYNGDFSPFVKYNAAIKVDNKEIMFFALNDVRHYYVTINFGQSLDRDGDLVTSYQCIDSKGRDCRITHKYLFSIRNTQIITIAYFDFAWLYIVD